MVGTSNESDPENPIDTMSQKLPQKVYHDTSLIFS